MSNKPVKEELDCPCKRGGNYGRCHELKWREYILATFLGAFLGTLLGHLLLGF